MQEPIFSHDDASLRSLLESILKSVPDAMIVIDQAGTMIAFSRAAEELFGYDSDSMIGQNVKILMAGHDHSHHDRYISNYLETGEKQIIGIGRVVEAKRSDGSIIPIELKIGEAQLEGRRLFTGFIRDLSDQKAAEHRLAQMQAELSNFSRLSAVGTMASAMAHELNQPLTAVANYLQAARDLLSTPDAETVEVVKEALGAASAQSIRAGQIVRRLRDYVSRGEIETQAVAPRALVQEAISLSKIGFDGPLARIIEQIDPDLPPVMADRLQIRQVIVNLIKNAMEALSESSKPMVWVSAELEGDDAVRISVRDNGPGFVEEHGHSLFDPFRSSKPNGMGLGLSICHTIVDAHGGRIWAESGKTEAGATMAFTLKRAAPEDTHA